MATKCSRCADNQRKAGEALSLFNEASSELYDVEELLRELERVISEEPFAIQVRLRIDKIRATLAKAGERKRVENGIREIIKPT